MSICWDDMIAREIATRRGVSLSEISLYRSVADRASFAYHHMRDAKGNPWVARGYQLKSLNSHAARKVHCDGRDVGKTSEIEIMCAWAVSMLPQTEMLIATQCDNHLFPLMERIVRRFETIPHYGADLIEVRRTPSWFLRFSNGFILWGRIAGPHGMNFQGLHVDWQIVDEAQELTETAWAELLQALNTGGWRWVYGVPNGLRNTFYRMSQMQDYDRYNWPSTNNPDFSAAKDAELALLYGGRSSPGYIHRVLGQHGSPAHAVFDLDHYLACVDESIAFDNITITEEDRFEAPRVEPGNYYLGCDLGYARDPSEFVIYKSEPPHLINVMRVHLQGVNYAKQQDVIRELDRAFAFRRIGIDAGNNGRAVAHNLLADTSIDWCDRILTIEFGGVLDRPPLPDGTTLRSPAKQLMTELLQRHMLQRTIVFPRLPERESQYASHTYAVGVSGQILFEKGNDHLIDADRCAVYAHDEDSTQYERAPNLGFKLDFF